MSLVEQTVREAHDLIVATDAASAERNRVLGIIEATISSWTYPTDSDIPNNVRCVLMNLGCQIIGIPSAYADEWGERTESKIDSELEAADAVEG